MARDRLIIGISGASGTVYGIRMLEVAKRLGLETHLVFTRSAKVTLAHETDWKVRDVEALADEVYSVDDIAAPVSSGSFRTIGMVVAPCSIRSLSEIAYGTTSNLLTRAADVVLKERRKLVLMVRETPLHLGHMRAMTAATESGAIVMPPLPAFYAKPESIDDIVTHSVVRALDLFGLDAGGISRWGEKPEAPESNPVAASGDNPFWRFACAVYSKDKVAPMCLELQDRFAVNVNVAIFAAWCGTLGRRLEASSFDEIDDRVAAWNDGVVRNIRQARRAWKELGEQDEALLTGREAIKTVELASERILCDMLYRHADSIRFTQASADRNSETIAHNVGLALARKGVEPSLAEEAASLLATTGSAISTN